jgi:Arc/MetJ family transcription regulator
VIVVRTNVVLDEDLIKKALNLGGYKTKKAAIEAGLRLVVQMNSQKRLRALRGKVTWEGDLDEMRKMQ